MIYTLGTTGLARALGILGSLVLVLVLGHYFEVSDLGVFAFSHALCTLGILVARSGHDHVLMRSVSRAIADCNPAGAQSHARFALRHALKLAIGLAAVAVAWVFANPFDLIDPESRRLLMIMLPAMPAAVLAWQCSGFFKGLGQTARAILLENGGVAALAAVLTTLTLVVATRAGFASDLTMVGYAFLVANLSVMGIGLCLYRQWVNRRVAADGTRADLSPRKSVLQVASRQFLLIHVMTYATQAGSFFLAGLLLPMEQVGLLWAAERLTLLISFICLVVNPVISPRIAAVFHQGRLDDLVTLVTHACGLCLLVSAPIAGVLFLFPKTMLAMLGSDLGAAAVYLRIMLIGHVVNAALGPVAHVLTMTRYEQVMKKLTGAVFVVSLVAYPALIWSLGPAGFAFCYTAMLVTKHISSVFLVRRKLGVWPLSGLRLMALPALSNDEK